MSHDIIWTQPPPVWPSLSVKFAPERVRTLQAPVILRFATDSFMDDFMNLLATEPHRLGDFKVRPETWRGFTPAPEAQTPPRGNGVLRHLRLFRPPARLGHSIVREPVSRPAAPPPALPLKLYQPGHQRFYLVTSSLVCRVPGLPDRTVDPGRDERAGFILRRLLPRHDNTDAWDEHAWIPGTQGAIWRKVTSGRETTLAEGEELLPMFGVNFAETNRRHRRLLAGMIPVGKREAYLGAARAENQPQSDAASRTTRKVLLRKDVIEPWKSLLTRARAVHRTLSAPPANPPSGDRAPSGGEKFAQLKSEREQIQATSWLLLLDLARYLSIYLQPVWLAIVDPGRAAKLQGAAADAYRALEQTIISPALVTDLAAYLSALASSYNGAAVAPDLRTALAHYGAPDGGLNSTLEDLLETNDQPFDFATANRGGVPPWPAFLFPLADPDNLSGAPSPPGLAAETLDEDDRTSVPPTTDLFLTQWLGRIDRLAAVLVRALEPYETSAPEPAVPIAAIAPADAFDGWFVIRCVYDRPACAPLERAIVSDKTEQFQLAGFFDPDAPARPIRIGLPIDTTPAGLRKFDKNTAIVISDTLCGQIQRIKGLTLGDLVRSVLPWPLHKDLSVADGGPCKTGNAGLGMMCSLSIPIVTICALILLMIMVSILDYIFRWLPYFIVCFPLPGIKAKAKPPAPPAP